MQLTQNSMKSILVSITIVSILSILVTSCKTSAQLVDALAEYNGRSVSYGSQGGIAGGGTTIILLENGQVFSTTILPKGESYHGKADIKEAKALIDEAMTLTQKHSNLSGTGNMTYFLVYKDGATEKKISWPAEVYPPNEVRAFAQKLNEFTQTKTK